MIRDRVKLEKEPRPGEEKPRDRTMIYRDEPREVPNVSFYRRAIRRGDLEIVTAPKPAARAPKKTEG